MGHDSAHWGDSITAHSHTIVEAQSCCKRQSLEDRKVDSHDAETHPSVLSFLLFVYTNAEGSAQCRHGENQESNGNGAATGVTAATASLRSFPEDT